jgi:IclR family pca regulon transcriptional regulator
VLQPTLNRLAAQTQESFSAVVLDGAEVVIVARSGQLRLLAYGLHLGARLPAHATSTGRVLLASLPPAEFEAWMAGEGSDRALPRLTPRTVVEPAAFRALIEQARRDDWCVASEEHELGIHALAVPLRNMQGKTVAALNVVAPPARLETAAIRRDLLPLLLDAARELRPLV